MVFQLDTRLGIELPVFETPFEELPRTEQEAILLRWETIRARIPDQIMRLEHDIEGLLQLVHEEEDWDIIASYFVQISDLASRINELNTWRRVDPSLHATVHDGQAEEHRAREK